jgi:hypothetical protein
MIFELAEYMIPKAGRFALFAVNLGPQTFTELETRSEPRTVTPRTPLGSHGDVGIAVPIATPVPGLVMTSVTPPIRGVTVVVPSR